MNLKEKSLNVSSGLETSFHNINVDEVFFFQISEK